MMEAKTVALHVDSRHFAIFLQDGKQIAWKLFAPNYTAPMKTQENVGRSRSVSGDNSVDGFSLDSQTQSDSGTTRESEKRTRTSDRFNPLKGFFGYAILIAAAVGFGFATYFLISTAQQNEFEAEFESYARETSDIAENNAENTFGQLQTLATAITSLVIDSKSSEISEIFPNATIPHFDLRAQEIADLTGAEMIMFVPFVEQSDRVGWEAYSNENQWWVEQDYDYLGWDVSSIEPVPEEIHSLPWFSQLNDTRRGYSNEDGFMEEIMRNLTYNPEGFSAPVAQFGPAPLNTSIVKLDLFAHQIFKKEIMASLEYDVPVISEPEDLEFLLQYVAGAPRDELRSFTLDQVKEDFREDSKTIGYIVGIVPWSTFFVNLLPDDVNGIVVTIESDCGGTFTYTVNGGKADEMAIGDQHDSKYDGMEVRKMFFWKEHPKGQSRHCHFDLVIYPSAEFEAIYTSSAPYLFGGAVALAFLFTGAVFFIFNRVMSKHQKKVQEQADRAEAIVASVFPKTIGDRLIAEADNTGKGSTSGMSSRGMLQNFLASGGTDQEARSKPIADLFPETSVMFADIVGFTAWSSTRDPSQVFLLLETIYKDFDRLAKRRGVYKVETVGDCYVAVAGLPEPRKDHFIAISRFANDVLTRMGALTSKLESELGPDTGDLGIRIGVHSGPVTAGVLRGERARFQLFGDTVNTAARMESNGKKNHIQISKETADLLDAAGKAFWLSPREDKIMAKGKGELQTFWLRIRGGDPQTLASANSIHSATGRTLDTNTESSDGSFSDSDLKTELLKANVDQRLERLINWNVDVLVSLLKQIERSRRSAETVPDSSEKLALLEAKMQSKQESSKTVIDEVVEVLALPQFKAGRQQDIEAVEISPEVLKQLREYVSTIAYMYNDNSFHNFEHASHVTMSVTKLLGRIVAADINSDDEKDLHDHTYGITSDPLTHFAVVFSAVLHDVDHPGVPNGQLIKEKTDTALLYNNQSVAEQNSVDLGWDLLMEEQFLDLRRAIYTTESELQRFRQMLVNTIMATDIMDKDLKKLRNDRWEKAFSTEDAMIESSRDQQIDRKATIVIEHLIQASDVAHTMQHWHVYIKWNEKLFHEMYRAFLEGRSDTDPSEGWYKGEIGFFDFYIIPLAKKLKECGVFGVSSDEYLNYAQTNRNEWESKGVMIVQGYVSKYKKASDTEVY